ncbi:type II toxin-antitoxin system ParD family antitoxin [Rubellimicrobium aerolatum]|uniref:Type II toxin-antitoxin system ParD family antitoxin n=1 Tax=Rubellimicrobium aerolatum TaxID=490979 RepID=A0ABW0S9J9_9RHOB|nr:type II toxin-antitoxin system ParD family antitoxin [Rubellimicrobium aerolatum]MBP1804985.1 antitoxin ParD1/3/4 [Rubellimicrobium aerolatum]
MPTRNVVLTDHLAGVVDGLVAKGRYQNASEAIRAGVRLLEDDEARMDALAERLHRAHERAVAGERAPGTGEEVVRRAFRTARAAHEARQAAKAAE